MLPDGDLSPCELNRGYRARNLARCVRDEHTSLTVRHTTTHTIISLTERLLPSKFSFGEGEKLGRVPHDQVNLVFDRLVKEQSADRFGMIRTSHR